MMTMGERAERALRIVRDAPIIAYDTEGSGLDWKRNVPVGYVITESEAENYYIPIRHGGGGNLNDRHAKPITDAEWKIDKPSDFESDLASAFDERNRKGYLTIGHSIKFDAHFSANAGIYLGRNLNDTQINASLLNEFLRSFSLDSCCEYWGTTSKKGDELYRKIKMYCDMEGVKCKEGRDSMGNFWRMPGNDPTVVEYAVGDGWSTLDLWRKQMEDIQRDDLDRVWLLESLLIWTVFRMERKGVRVDEDAAIRLKQELINRNHTLLSKMPPDFNPRSSTKVREFLEAAGVTDWPMTAPTKRFPNGQPSFNEKWLKKSDAGKQILDIRKGSNMVNSFITPLLETHMWEGRVHAGFNQNKSDEYGTISGRFSSSNPNLQQVPKRNKELGRMFRELYIPDDDMLFVEADYSQCEPRLFAHYAKEETLLKGYSQDPPRDVHQVVADLFDVERDPTAKRMNMGIFTGMQPRTFAQHMDWDLETATTMHNKWFEMFSGIRGFQSKAKAVFRNRGYVRTLLGRRCRLDNPRWAYRATSRIIQGGNADILKYKMLEVDLYLESLDDIANLLLTVHDSLGWQTPKGDAGEKINVEIVQICQDVQSPPFNLRLPFTMDIGVGVNWGEATYG